MKRPFKMPVFNRRQMICFVTALLVLLCSIALSRNSQIRERTAYADIQLAAAQRMSNAMHFLHDYVLQNGIPIEADDINQTGIIGPEWTELTTSLGHLEAKRTSLQPDFAALMVKYYQQIGLKAGDVVACGMSGSFPGLCIASVAAANEMGLSVKVIASYGASMYGATRMELSIVRILLLCKAENLLQFEFLAASPGGDDDQGGSLLFPNSREEILAMAKADGVFIIDESDVPQSVEKRLALYGDDLRCFVNVGGASANVGTSPYTLSFPNGLVVDPPRIPVDADRGMMFEYAARGIPVIHLLNIRGLAEANGLPVDPVPLTLPGETDVSFTTRQSPWYAIAGLMIAVALLFMGKRREKKRL